MGRSLGWLPEAGRAWSEAAGSGTGFLPLSPDVLWGGVRCLGSWACLVVR